MVKKYGIRIKWLTVTCFEISDGNATVVSDPCITDSPTCTLSWENVENCDYITLSHSHWDHITDIPKLLNKFQPLLICGDQTAMPLARWTNYNPSMIYPMYPDMELDFDKLKIRALYGRHTNQGTGYNDQVKGLATRDAVLADFSMNELQAYGSMEYRNYLFTFPNGTKVLLWGNDATAEQRNMLRNLKPDIAILQYTKQARDPAGMAALAKEIGCKVLIPHHMDLRKREEDYMPGVKALQLEFLKQVPDGSFICPKNGQWIDL